MRTAVRQVVLLAAPLLLVACGAKAPPPPVTPATSSLAAAPAPAPSARGRSPWQNSRFFQPKQPAPAPLFTRPRRPTRGPAIHTLRS